MKNIVNTEHPFYEQPLESQLLYDGKVVRLYKDTVGLADGKRAYREIIRHNGAVCVLPLTERGEAVCVTQYRHAIGRLTLELPAGKLDSKDEDPASAALRELKEETGLECDRLTCLGKMHGSPAILDEEITIYLAEGLREGEACPDEGEFLAVRNIPLAELVQMVMNGEITDAKTQVAAMKAYIRKRNENIK